MAQQLGFFQDGKRLIAATPAGKIVYFPAAFGPSESAALFEVLSREIPWSTETMHMYDRIVDVPRLVAWYGAQQELPPALVLVKERAEGALAVRFNAVSLNYYRDGNDSVAWHSDRNEQLTEDPIVALASFGATRSMLFRTKAPPRRQLRCDLEPGSLLAMCGDVQDHWEHHIPKVPRPTDARISVALRTKAERSPER